MEIVINNPEDGRRLAAEIGNQLIAEILYQMVLSEPEPDRCKIYEQLIKYMEELCERHM
ncbi:hypothetical protein [Anaerocolumna jejuensis]|uniref:hypothetical protein n=1 Tax=Anaerocolumna jejuensis TaxID=259063 RepID=UPI001479EDB6|nr:hypothetical protein [Anaerocolumna jejuensis]